MKKIRYLAAAVAVVALAAFVLAGCSSGGSASSASSSSGSSSTASSSSSAATSEDFTLVVGFDAEYPPYGFMADDGSYTGFDLDLAEAVCEANGWEFQAKPIDWDSKDAELGSGSINCIWNGFTMEGREGQYTFSEPYMLNEQVVVVKAGSGIETFADLAGKVVLTQAGSAAYELLTDDEADLAATFASLETTPDYQNAFMQLDSGAVQAVACDLSVASYYLAHSDGQYAQLAEPLSSEHYAVGFKLGDEETAEAVTGALKDLYADGTVAELCEKYGEDGITIENWTLK